MVRTMWNIGSLPSLPFSDLLTLLYDLLFGLSMMGYLRHGQCSGSAWMTTPMWKPVGLLLARTGHHPLLYTQGMPATTSRHDSSIEGLRVWWMVCGNLSVSYAGIPSWKCQQFQYISPGYFMVMTRWPLQSNNYWVYIFSLMYAHPALTRGQQHKRNKH
jgi:hypothetical protein